MENSIDTVTIARLEDNKVENIHDYKQSTRVLSIDNEEDTDLIRRTIELADPVLVIFDTLNTYIGKADTHKSSESQQAFGFFRQIAKDHNCAVWVLRHLTKSKGGEKALYRGQGSIAFAALARVVMAVGVHPEDPDVRVMAVTKINVTKAPPSLCFTVDELPNDHSKFTWGKFVNLSGDDILAHHPKVDGSANVLDEAKEFLKDSLAGGSIPSAKIKRMAEKRSISPKNLQRAADALGIERMNGQWGLP